MFPLADAPPDRPFAGHEAFVAGLRQGRYKVAVRYDPRSLGLLDTAADRVATALIVYSPALLASAALAWAYHTSQPAFLVALPMAWLDYRAATARLTLLDLLHWLPWWLIALLVRPFAPAVAWALFVVAPCLLLTRFLGSAGRGMLHSAVLDAVERSAPAFDQLLARGTIAVYDTTDHTWYGHPIARASEQELRQLS